MLRQHPLRELSIDVKINSVVPLAKVASPTHAVRATQTEHSRTWNSNARRYTPTRNFEVVAELQGKQPELTLIPHRRGDDGYFMLMLAPPGPKRWPTIATCSPTRRRWTWSCWPIRRPRWMLGSGPSKRSSSPPYLVRSRPATRSTWPGGDVNCDWVFRKGRTRGREKHQGHVRFLDRRGRSAGPICPRRFPKFSGAGQDTCIVYVGDGIPTVGDTDPAAVAAEIRRLYETKCKDKKPVCHAVSVGSTFESGVLKAIASLGGGSMREISGEQGARAAALDLLKEITRPALRDLKLQFRVSAWPGLSPAVAEPARRRAADHPRPLLAEGERAAGQGHCHRPTI